jgi:hypothetical protein
MTNKLSGRISIVYLRKLSLPSAVPSYFHRVLGDSSLTFKVSD